MLGHSQTLSSAQKKRPNSAISDSSAAGAASIARQFRDVSVQRVASSDSVTERHLLKLGPRSLSLRPLQLRCSGELSAAHAQTSLTRRLFDFALDWPHVDVARLQECLAVSLPRGHVGSASLDRWHRVSRTAISSGMIAARRGRSHRL